MVANKKEAFSMGISSISSSTSSILNLLGKSTASSEEASQLSSKISDLESQIEETSESDDDEETKQEAITAMQAQVTQYQIRLAQIAGENVSQNMHEQLDALNANSTSLSKLNSHLIDIIA